MFMRLSDGNACSEGEFKMELLQFLRGEMYTGISFHNEYNKPVCCDLGAFTSNEQLLLFMELKPTTVKYFPMERNPYLICSDQHHSQTYFLST